MKGLGNIMKQAQQMKENLEKAQQELASLEIIGEAGGGLVSVVMTGRHEVKRVKIDDSLLKNEDDKDMIEDLVAAAINDAVHKVERTMQEKFSGFTSGMGMPGDFKLPF